MVDADMNPLPVFHTLKLLVNKLDGYTSVERIVLDDNNVYCYKFTVNNKAVYVLWYDDNKNQLPHQGEGKKQVALWIGTDLAKVTKIITDIDQTEPVVSTEKAEGGTINIEVTEVPIILEGI